MNQVQLLNVLSNLYPASPYPRDYTVSVDGSGNATIATWSGALGTQPTTDQLATELSSLQMGQAQQSQVSTLQASSNLAQSTFTSSALGSAYTYPSAPADQANLTACVTYSLFPSNPSDWTVLFYCTSSTGVSTYLPHTAAQIQQVGQDAMTAIMSQKSKMATLAAEVMAASSVTAVQSIIWN